VNIGVFLASHNNPMFLRLALLQLEAQTVLPTVLAIHDNGHNDRALPLVGDVYRRLLSKGVTVLYDHNPPGMCHPFFHYLPLKRLVDNGRCDVYTKWDHDDLFYEDHLESLVTRMRKTLVMPPDLDWIGKRRADVLVLREPAYLFKQNREFTWNPLGGMSDTFMFNDKVAREYLQDMLDRAGTKEADDWILHKYTLPKFPQGVMLDSRPTTCYVSHGRNDSTRHWMAKPPDDLLNG